jgi:hypothetical protein
MGFLAPTAFEAAGSDQHRACLTRLCCAFGLSQTLDAFFLPEPSRLCFTPYTLMGFLSSEVFPPDRPARLSTVLTLVTFLVDRGPGDMRASSGPASLTIGLTLQEGGPGGSIRGGRGELMLMGHGPSPSCSRPLNWGSSIPGDPAERGRPEEVR